jgi:two-component system response regulator AtoC
MQLPTDCRSFVKVGCRVKQHSNCLIVDGFDQHTERLVDLCTSLSCTVTVCTSLAEANRYLKEASPVLAFLAMEIADAEGVSLFNALRAKNIEVMLMASGDDPEHSRKAIHLGARYFFYKPFEESFIRTVLFDVLAEQRVNAHPPHNDQHPRAAAQFGRLRGSSPPMQELYRLLRKVSSTEASLMVVGESGTGKELVARTAHELSNRADKPFIAVNCAAVSATLVASELFGHEKGSFSGAIRRHHGYFECARGGTLLLDEICEMNMEMQATLLRVLESNTLRPVGSEEDIDIDVRVISATNRDPQEAIRQGLLREDLYFRLAHFQIRVPPLRERSADIEKLAQQFLDELNQRHGTSLEFSRYTLIALARNSWPGNVRQLRHAVERAYIVSNDTIEPEALPASNELSLLGQTARSGVQISLHQTLAESQRRLILATLNENGGNKRKTASELGVSLKTLYNRLNMYSQLPGEKH